MAMGRPKSPYIKDAAGREIVGLRGTPVENPTRFYTTDPDTREKVFIKGGTDLNLVILEFKRWQRQRTRPVVTIEDPAQAAKTAEDPVSIEIESLSELREGALEAAMHAARGTRWDIPEEEFWAETRRRFNADPVEFAHNMNCPWMARPDLLEDAKPSLLLSEAWAMYLKRKKQPMMQTRSDNYRYWKKFTAIVKVDSVADVTADVIGKYNDAIHDEHAKHPTTVRHSFSLIKSVFKHAATKGKDIERLKTVMLLLDGLEYPEKPGPNPITMTAKDFKMWLDASDPKHKAILLLMLNAATRPQYVASLRWRNADGSKSVDLDAGTVVARRGKRGKVVCCCKLWPRTVKAIRDWLKAEPHEQPTVFVNEIGTPYASGRILAHGLRQIKKKTTLPESVKIKHIRSGAVTACVMAKIPDRDIRILSGHRTGTPDWYVQRGVYMVEDACAAIERHYFPPK